MLIEVPEGVQTAVTLTSICTADAQKLSGSTKATNRMILRWVCFEGRQTKNTIVNVVVEQSCNVCKH